LSLFDTLQIDPLDAWLSLSFATMCPPGLPSIQDILCAAGRGRGICYESRVGRLNGSSDVPVYQQGHASCGLWAKCEN